MKIICVNDFRLSISDKYLNLLNVSQKQNNADGVV